MEKNLTKKRLIPLWLLVVTVVFIIFLLLAIILLIIFLSNALGEPRIIREQVCVQKKKIKPTIEPMTEQQKEGFQTSAQFLKLWMKPEADPCEDFWEFACGAKPPVSSRMSAANANLKTTLHKSVLGLNVSSSPKPLRKIYSYLKTIYDNCFTSAGDAQLLQQVQEIVHDIGGSPVLDGAKNTTEPVINPFSASVRLLKHTGIQSLVKFKKEKDLYHPKKSALSVLLMADILFKESTYEGTIGYGKIMNTGGVSDFAEDEIPKLMVKYQEDVIEAVKEIGLVAEKLIHTRFSRAIDTAISMEEVRNISHWLADAVAEQANQTDLDGTRIFWTLEYLGEIQIPLDLKSLGEVTGVVHSHWHMLQANIVEEFLQTIFDKVGYKRSRKNLCTKAVLPSMNNVILSVVMKTFEDIERKTLRVRNLVEQLRLIFNSLIFTLDWMGTVTKNKALNKLLHIIPRIMVPPVVFNDTQFAEYYKGLPELYGNETLMSLIQMVNSYEVDQQFLDLGKVGPTKYETFMTERAFQTNAFYKPDENTINILLGFLTPPIFDWNYPEFMNYAGIGMVIGHELTHGFDVKGSKYDLNGDFRQWMPNEDLEAYQKKAMCFAEQFSQFCFNVSGVEKCVNGNATLGETMADDGGIRLAYFGFNLFINMAKQVFDTDVFDANKLPGFENFTTNQQFFLAYANTWCEDRPTDKMDLDDVHPPNQVRVLGTLQNFWPFAKAFKCPRGSGMNPRKKCRVW